MLEELFFFAQSPDVRPRNVAAAVVLEPGLPLLKNHYIFRFLWSVGHVGCNCHRGVVVVRLRATPPLVFVCCHLEPFCAFFCLCLFVTSKAFARCFVYRLEKSQGEEGALRASFFYARVGEFSDVWYSCLERDDPLGFGGSTVATQTCSAWPTLLPSSSAFARAFLQRSLDFTCVVGFAVCS